MKKKTLRKKKENFIVGNYKKCYSFLNEISWYVVFALGIFMFTFLIGFSYPHFFEEEIKTFIQGLITSLDGKSISYLVGYIFANNIKAALFSFVLGITFGVFPLITLITNGYLLGFVSRMVVSGEGGLFVLLRLLPHGIFELPAILLSIGIGLKIGHDLMRKYNWKEEKNIISYIIFIITLLVTGICLLIIGSNIVNLFNGWVGQIISAGITILFALISLTISFNFSLILFPEKIKNQRKLIAKKYVSDPLRFFFSVILPLLIIAAIIEGVLIGLRV